MGISLHPVSGTGQQYAQSAIKTSTDFTPAVIPQTQTVSPPVTPAGSAYSNESQYQAAIVQAAISFKNVYAISDQSFSIFKDATGKYITRYVSLRDGKVTYVPEPTLVKQIELSGGDSSSRVAISA